MKKKVIINVFIMICSSIISLQGTQIKEVRHCCFDPKNAFAFLSIDTTKNQYSFSVGPNHEIFLENGKDFLDSSIKKPFILTTKDNTSTKSYNITKLIINNASYPLGFDLTDLNIDWGTLDANQSKAPCCTVLIAYDEKCQYDGIRFNTSGHFISIKMWTQKIWEIFGAMLKRKEQKDLHAKVSFKDPQTNIPPFLLRITEYEGAIAFVEIQTEDSVKVEPLRLDENKSNSSWKLWIGGACGISFAAFIAWWFYFSKK